MQRLCAAVNMLTRDKGMSIRCGLSCFLIFGEVTAFAGLQKVMPGGQVSVQLWLVRLVGWIFQRIISIDIIFLYVTFIMIIKCVTFENLIDRLI